MHFLKPNLMSIAKPGIYAFGITDTNEFEEPIPGDNKIVLAKNQSVHATMCVNSEGISLPVSADVDFVGIAQETFAAVIGIPINAELLLGLRKTEDFFDKQSKVGESDISSNFKNVKSNDHASGMVL